MTDEPQCERCLGFFTDRHCVHGMELCPDCLWACHGCQLEDPKSPAYDTYWREP